MVIPVPDSGVPAALGFANQADIPFELGIIRNHYVGRTFIEPSDSIRHLGVRLKHNPNRAMLKGKRVVLVDDSIVRGTTSQQIVQMARDAGARKVYLASAAPPVRHPNIYGIDMPSADELIAHGRSIEEIEKQLGCDWLIYQDLEDLEAAVREGNPDLKRFDSSCFDGEYVTGIEPGYFERIQQMRSDEAKRKRRAS
jgi:amidophosphoribosyltransferase